MPIPEAELTKDDGLIAPEVGLWATTKHRKIAYYSSLFATSMKKKWDFRVYIDLFAGSGKARIRDTQKIIPGSPLRALNTIDPFNKYIFCEKSSKNMDALKQRVKSLFEDKDCSFILGDANICTEDILKAIPPFTKNFRGLSFCLADPYKMGDLHFDTIRKIAAYIYVDFLILIPSYMDINRNPRIYLKASNQYNDNYLGTATWRHHWMDINSKKKGFGAFIAEEFCKQIKSLGYLYESFSDLELVRMETGKNLPLYHLAFFSRNELGLKFWRTTKKSTSDQRTLW